MFLQTDYTYADVDYVDTWKSMEKLVKNGLTKAIGLSNFNITQIQRVLDNADIKPAALEIEVRFKLYSKLSD